MDFLNTIDTPNIDEAVAEDFGLGLSITQAEVTGSRRVPPWQGSGVG